MLTTVCDCLLLLSLMRTYEPVFVLYVFIRVNALVRAFVSSYAYVLHVFK